MTRRFDRSTKAASVGAVAAVAAFVAGMYAARATPGGETRRALSFAGTLTGRTGPQTLVFTFRKGSTSVCAPTVTATPDVSTGAVHVEIPLTSCPTTLFDGSDVTYEVSVGGVVLAPSAPVNPVPYAAYADRVGTPDCPNGYVRFTEPSMPAQAVYCRNGVDEVVRVGTGQAAFWIDRYLDSVWSNADGTGTRYDGGSATPFPANGNWTTPLYAFSKRGVASSGGITWHQAVALCAIVGKRIPSLDELLIASRGVPGFARTSSVPADECPASRGFDYNTGSTPQCISIWGAEQIAGYRNQWSRDLTYINSYYSAGTLTHQNINGFIFFRIVEANPPPALSPAFPQSGFRCMIPR